MERHTPIAIIADVHGNSWALDAVLADITQRGITRIINLGDSVYGPLDPAGTAERLIEVAAVNVRGNQDRLLLALSDHDRTAPTFQFVMEHLSPLHLTWLNEHLPNYVFNDVFCCHGTPTSDDTYLLEDVQPTGVFLATPQTVMAHLNTIDHTVVLCGHTHVARTVWLPDGTLVVNPGSVGLPAYDDNAPYPHRMEAGSPHARYAVLTSQTDGYTIEQIALPYAWDEAADAATRNGRHDWAIRIATGRVAV